MFILNVCTCICTYDQVFKLNNLSKLYIDVNSFLSGTLELGSSIKKLPKAITSTIVDSENRRLRQGFRQASMPNMPAPVMMQPVIKLSLNFHSFSINIFHNGLMEM